MPGFFEFIIVVDSEASDSERPYFGDVAGAEVPRDVPGGVGTVPIEE